MHAYAFACDGACQMPRIGYVCVAVEFGLPGWFLSFFTYIATYDSYMGVLQESSVQSHPDI